MPSVIFETLANDATLNSLGVDGTRIFELQTIAHDETPDVSTYLVVINMQEATFISQDGSIRRPRVMEISVHISWDQTRSYQVIDQILNRIDELLLPMEQEVGGDGIRVTSVGRQGRTGNLQDEGWRTTTRHATYGVLYDESAA